MEEVVSEVVGHAKEVGEKGKAQAVWRWEIGEEERRRDAGKERTEGCWV